MGRAPVIADDFKQAVCPRTSLRKSAPNQQKECLVKKGGPSPDEKVAEI